MNVVRVTALDDVDPLSEAAAVEVVEAFDRRGGASFLVADASTENAVLLCQVDPDETPRDVLDRARRTGAELGVLFDCGDQLAGATRVDPSTVARTLRSFDGAS